MVKYMMTTAEEIAKGTAQGFEIMGIGIGIVFFVLLLFFFIIKLMMKIWPAKDSNE